MGGFIYIWYDLKKKKFYVGSHWGSENDSYVCSSTWMKRAYKRRPQDFKRRILQRSTDQKELLNLEERWLSLISDDQLGRKYYNLNKHVGHWSVLSLEKTKEKLRLSWTQERRTRVIPKLAAVWKDEKYRKNFSLKTVGRKRSSETILKMKERWTFERRQAQAKRLSKISTIRYKNWWLTHKTRREKLLEKREAEGWKPANRSLLSIEQWDKLRNDPDKLKIVKDKMSQSAKARIRVPVSDEAKANMSAATLGKKQKIVKCPHCDKEGGSATMHQKHFDHCKFKK